MKIHLLSRLNNSSLRLPVQLGRVRHLALLIIALLLNALPTYAQVSPPSWPILFVHGWCGSPYDWSVFFTPFSTALPSSMYSNQTVYLVQYDSVTSAITFWVENDPSAGSGTTLTSIAEDAIPSTARFFALQFIDPTPTSTNPIDPTNVAKISVLNKAYEISQVVANIKTITNAQQVNILSHSMGGLDARAYVENMASTGACYDYATDTPDYTAATCTPGAGNAAWTGNVANIITLDTPNTGSPLADSSLRKLIGLDGYECEATTTTNSVEITPSNALLESLNYGGTELGTTLPATLDTPVQAIEDYEADVTKSWTGLTGDSDDIVQLTSQSITENIPATDSTATLVDIPFSYPSATVLADSGCTVSLLGTLEPIMHFLSCLGTLDQTLDQVETQLVDDTVPWISSWSVTPTTQPLGSNFTIAYSATDLSSYTLSSAELWRAPDKSGAPGTWSEVGTAQTLSGSGPTAISFTDAPPTAGKFWYGSHLYDSGGNEAIEFPPTQVTVTETVAATPSFSPVAGTYTSAQSVTISDSTANVTIYYTTNSSAPTTSSTSYTGAISVSSTETIEAIAAGASNTPSAVATAIYTITPPAATPIFSPAAGTYTSAQSVTISDTTPGSSIYYTTNATTPTTGSSKYTAAIPVSATETLEAIAVAGGYIPSAVSSAIYTIESQAATPSFSPAAGTYTSTQSVTISDTTPGSSIYYTTNATTPTTGSSKYTAAISVSSTETIEAIAAASGHTNSALATAVYTINSNVVPASLTTPTPGSKLTGTSVTFAWNPGNTAKDFVLYVGNAGIGSSNLYYSGLLTSTSQTVSGLPGNGQPVYVRLYWYIGGTWRSADYSYTASGSPTQATLTTPTPGSTLTGTSVAFSWTPGNTATQFVLYVGSNGVGSSNLYNSGLVTTTTVIVSGLPRNGLPVYVELFSYIDGTLESTNYTYMTAGTTTQAALTTPTPGSKLTGTSVAFAWTPGNAAKNFELWVGNTGIGSSNLYNSGYVTATSEIVSGLPNNDSTIYVRLYSYVNGGWVTSDYTYTSAGTATQATLTSPTPGSTLSGTSVTFSWTPGNTATQFVLYVGSNGVGSSNLYNSGLVTTTTVIVSGLPRNGLPVYVELFSYIDGTLESTNYTYMTAGTTTQAALTTPTPGSKLTGTSVAFAWTPGNAAKNFELWVGNTGIGSSNLYNSGYVTATSEIVSGLPNNDSTIYVRLYSYVNGGWVTSDYTYTSAGTATQATLTSPTPGSTLSGTSVTFSWTPGNSAINFVLYVGSTGVGSSNLYSSSLLTATSATVSDLPSNKQPVYVRLYSYINGTWESTDYTYTAF